MAGCASTGPNVRALRMVQRERPTPALLREHVREMRDTLALIELLLKGTPYRPGAPWVAKLPLGDAEAARAKDLIHDAAGRASFVWVYATHVNSVLEEARRDIAQYQPPEVPSLAVPAPPLPAAPVVPAPLAPEGVTLPGVPEGNSLPAVPGVTAPIAGVPGNVPVPATVPQPRSVMPHYPSLVDALAGVHPALTGQSAQAEQSLARAVDEANQKYATLMASASDPNELARQQAERTRLAVRLTELRAQLSRPVSTSDLRDPEKEKIVRDALVVTSIALRLTVEAISLATVVAYEAAALTGQSPASWLKGAPDEVGLAMELPDEARQIYASLQADSKLLHQLLGELSRLQNVEPLKTIGFEFKDGLVDDIVGLTWDSVHLDLQAGGEALYYAALADSEQSSDGNGNTFDYTGRQTKLEYDVEPIVLAQVRLALKVDWPHWAEALGIKLGYATNRVYKSGGEVSNGSLANELGVKGKLSEALDAGLAVAGVRANVRLAHFNHGTVRDILVADGSLLADAPLTFDLKQIDLGYDLAPRGGPYLQALTVGFRYFDYTLPRILYELTNSTPGAETKAYVFSRETPPQAIRTRYYMAALSGRIEKAVTPHFKPYFSLDVAAGYGPTQYYFLRDPNGDDVESNHDDTSSSSVGVNLAGVLGFRWFVGGPEARLNAFLDLRYQAQAIASVLDSKNDGDTIVNVGATDVLHGPVAALGVAF